MNDPGKQPTVAGTLPWLPWPLSTSGWWTTPVRAEYLAVLRIGIALVLLHDQLFQYLPCLDLLYGKGSTGSPELYRDQTQTPWWHWTLFYGLDHSLVSAVSLLAWLVLTFGIAARIITLPAETKEPHPWGPGFKTALSAWLTAGLVYVLGLWVRDLADGPTILVWLVPAILFGVATILASAYCIRRTQGGWWFMTAWGVYLLVLFAGIALAVPRLGEFREPFRNLFVDWGDNFTFLLVVFLVWVGFTLCLVMGLFTRLSAVIVWVLLVSFSNLNPDLNSKGDAIRNIIVFYTMLCPCWAAWSLDSIWQRKRGLVSGPVYVSPWALRLLLLQLALIYCFTGLIKLFSLDWLTGETLYYVLADLVLSRSSLANLPLPPWLLQASTWFVLFMEVTFPVWVLLRWTRTLALLLGASLHLGTLALMELGGFELYMFVLYLPLLPWARLLRDPGYNRPLLSKA